MSDRRLNLPQIVHTVIRAYFSHIPPQYIASDWPEGATSNGKLMTAEWKGTSSNLINYKKNIRFHSPQKRNLGFFGHLLSSVGTAVTRRTGNWERERAEWHSLAAWIAPAMVSNLRPCSMGCNYSACASLKINLLTVFALTQSSLKNYVEFLLNQFHFNRSTVQNLKFKTLQRKTQKNNINLRAESSKMYYLTTCLNATDK